jgi:alpha-glucosidase
MVRFLFLHFIVVLNFIHLGILPGRGQVTWRDFYNHAVVSPTTDNSTVTLSAPLGHINVHIRDSSILLLHAQPAYTIEKTRQGPFSLLCSLAANGQAFGSAYIDDGISDPPGPNTTIMFSVANNTLRIEPVGSFNVSQMVESITILGAMKQPQNVSVQEETVSSWEFLADLQKLVIKNITVDLNVPQVIQWT